MPPKKAKKTVETAGASESTASDAIPSERVPIPSERVRELFGGHRSGLATELEQVRQGLQVLQSSQQDPVIVQVVEENKDLEEVIPRIEARLSEVHDLATAVRNGTDAFFQQSDVQQVAAWLARCQEIRTEIQLLADEFFPQGIPSDTSAGTPAAATVGASSSETVAEPAGSAGSAVDQ